MPESKRQCSTCKFFQNAQLSGNGWCTHPKRQVASDVKILVRERELACRNTWGDDLWIDASSNATTPEIPAPTRREFTYLNTKFDDEVTSVVDSGAITRPAGQSQDDVVTFTSVRPDVTPARPATPEHDVNFAAVADQEERARQIARGSRHAIDSARARHVRRWTPAKAEDEVVPGNTSQPEPPVTDDQVINADHRSTPVAPASFGDSRFDVTGPVPRAEIEAHGALPPLPDSEPEAEPARPGPTVIAGVDLPRLRNFLRPDDGQASAPVPAPAAASVQAPATSNFEHVIRQAERIKALSKSERAAHTRSTPTPAVRPMKLPESRPTPVPEPKRVVARESRTEDVVWDMDKDELSATLALARKAIEDRPSRDMVTPEPEEPRTHPSVVTEHHEEPLPLAVAIDQSVESPEPELIAEPSFAPVQVEDLTAGFDVEPAEFDVEPEESFDQDLIVDEMEPLEDWEYVEPWEDESVEPIAAELHDRIVEQPAPPTRRDSPRGSWWRSLNFGIKRRYQQDPAPVEPMYDLDDVEPVHHEPMEAREADHAYDGYDVVTGDEPFADDDLYWHESPAEPVAEEAWWPEEIVEDELFEEPLPLAAERQETAASHLSTSDESWLMDAREFPDPQPVEWHQSRTELLAQRPEIEPRPLSRRERREPVEEIEWIEPRAATPRHHEQPRPRRTRPEPREYIPIDQPRGLDAFRDALFGDTSSSGLMEAPQRIAAEYAPPPAAFDDHEDYEPAPRGRRREALDVYPEPEPIARIEPEYEPVSARPAPRERSTGRENRRDREHRSARAFDRPAEDVFDIRRAVADPDDISITRQLDVENGVAKCCLTCRSFQPGDEPGRGWCMNSWAGTYRQMVNADTLACQSSIGNWWIAADTSWIPPSDSIQPRTPRTDRLVARTESREDQDLSKRSRVRTGKVG